MKTKIKAKQLLSTRLELLADKVDREIRKMNDAGTSPEYPAEMLELMKKVYYELGKAAFVADKIEEEKGWALDNDLTKISEALK
jgi:hypothetical protein